MCNTIGTKTAELHPCIDSFSFQLKEIFGICEIFGVSNKQMTFWRHNTVNLFKHLTLRGVVKINHYISTKHDVKLLIHIPRGRDQIKGAKLNLVTHLWLDANAS